MASDWSRETIEEAEADDYSWTAADLYNFFGSLVNDNAHSRYSNTAPYTNWVVDNINAAIEIIDNYCPSRLELISRSTVADRAVYELPHFVAATNGVHFASYDGDNIQRTTNASILASETGSLNFDSFGESGTPERYMLAGSHHIRLVPAPSGIKTLKLLISTRPIVVTSAMTEVIKLPAHLKTAPAYRMASIALSSDTDNLERSRYFLEQFWHMVNKAREDDSSPIDPPDVNSPGRVYRAPDFSTDDL